MADYPPAGGSVWEEVIKIFKEIEQELYENKKAFQNKLKGFKRIWQLPTLPHCCAVPSAMRGLTSLFGMGRGEHPRQNHHK